MNLLLKKLNYKPGSKVFLIHAPETFKNHLEEIKKEAVVKTKVDAGDEIHFILAFVQTEKEIEAIAAAIASRLQGDALIWMAYPKGTSKRYRSEINRDKGWAPLGKLDFEPVRLVAIDEDWSALRFRKVDYIKTMNRNPDFTISEKGKSKTAK